MAFRFVINGLEIVCDSLDELREAVAAFAGNVQLPKPSHAPVSSLPSAKPPTTRIAKNKSGGPAKGWMMARWYAEREGIPKADIARSQLADLRRSDFNAYMKLEKEFFASQEGGNEKASD